MDRKKDPVWKMQDTLNENFDLVFTLFSYDFSFGLLRYNSC